jgi:hypothetical protein
MTDYDRKNERLVDKWMAKWAGGNAMLWDYSASHRMLVVRVTIDGTPGNLHIVCGDTVHVCGPVRWTGAMLELIVEPVGPDGPTYVVRDVGAGFLARCGLVEAKENVKPIF